jgi:CheY-like chemotaxis protein
MDGFAVARSLRELGERGRGLRLVAVSGYAQADDLARAEAAGFDRHVAKPADPAEIERLLAAGADAAG